MRAGRCEPGGPGGWPVSLRVGCRTAPPLLAALALAALGLRGAGYGSGGLPALFGAGLPRARSWPSPGTSPAAPPRTPSPSTARPSTARPSTARPFHGEAARGEAARGEASPPSTTRPASPRGPFASYLLVLHNVREERRYLYARYYELFWDVWESRAPGRGPCDPVRGNCVSACNTATCLAGIFGSLDSLKGPAPAGALWIHADMWINPGLFPIERLDGRKVWITDSGLLLRWHAVDKNNDTIKDPNGNPKWMEQEVPNRCLEGEELYGHFLETGNWFTTPLPDHRPTATNRAPFLDQGLQILRRPEVQALPALRNWGQNRLCFGWVDILYIPYHVWPDWRQLTSYFGSVFHEVAAYTMLNMLVRSGRAPGVETIDFCEGNCCHTQAPKAILTSPCGHKMNLINDDVRDIFEGVLRMYKATEKANRSGSASRLPRLGRL